MTFYQLIKYTLSSKYDHLSSGVDNKNAISCEEG